MSIILGPLSQNNLWLNFVLQKTGIVWEYEIHIDGKIILRKNYKDCNLQVCKCVINNKTIIVHTKRRLKYSITLNMLTVMNKNTHEKYLFPIPKLR